MNKKMLIDARPILQDFIKIADRNEGKNPYENVKIKAYRRCFERVADAPKVDAVEVVRCKDCDYGYLWTNFFGRKIGKCAFLIGDNQCVPEDGYCYVGKRKEQ